ncbi:unnamed protein product, partial [marine sediment metagenome]
MPEKKKDATFEKMYGKLEEGRVAEKASGTPDCRSDRQHLEDL